MSTLFAAADEAATSTGGSQPHSRPKRLHSPANEHFESSSRRITGKYKRSIWCQMVKMLICDFIFCEGRAEGASKKRREDPCGTQALIDAIKESDERMTETIGQLVSVVMFVAQPRNNQE